MTEIEGPKTLLQVLIQQQLRLTWAEAAKKVNDAADREEGRSSTLTPRHLARLAKRETGASSPNPATCRALEYAFGRPIADLLAPHKPSADTTGSSGLVLPSSDAHKEVLTLAAKRAEKFALNLPGMADLTMEQVAEGVRDLAIAYPTRPLPEILGNLISAQDTIFGLLERPQRPSHGRQLYFLGGVVGGMLAKASHDLADPTAALTQSRTAYLCAQQADHNGLRGWISGLQSLVSYWAGRPNESIRYAQRGAEFAKRAGTAAVWLPANEARAWARLGNAAQAQDAIRRAEAAWDSVQPDELDELGGIASFSRARQLYYSADALAWLPQQGAEAEDYATQAVNAYSNPAGEDWAFGDEAGSRCDLAIARVARGELEGAAEAIAPVLTLPPEQRMAGIVKSLQHVHQALNQGPDADDARELQERIETFTRSPLQALPR